MTTLKQLEKLVKDDKNLSEQAKVSIVVDIKSKYREVEEQETLKKEIEDALSRPFETVFKLYQLDGEHIIFYAGVENQNKRLYYMTYNFKEKTLYPKISFSIYEQILYTIGYRLEGSESKFGEYSSKMLGLYE